MNTRPLLLAALLLALAACGRSATASAASSGARLDDAPDTTAAQGDTTGRGVNMGGGGN